MGWFDYFNRRPPGWKDDLRAYYIMARSGMSEMKGKAEDIFPSLKQVKLDGRTEETASLKSSLFGAMLKEHGIS